MNIEQLHAYLDGELTAEEAARVEHALAADPALAAQLDQLKSVDDALDTLPGAAVSPDFTDRVVAAARPKGRLVRLLVPLAAAAAAVAAAVFLTSSEETPAGDPFTADDYAAYTWEADVDTYGSLSLSDLEDQILEELEAT